MADQHHTEAEVEVGGMVFIMGITGAGKSYFINKLKEGSVVESSSMNSTTSRCQVIETTIGNSPVAIVDTPGFDDTSRPDEEIFRDIAKFFVCQYKLGIPLKGIIYLHRITDNGMQGSAVRAMRMFKALCGEEALDRVVLATTMWSKLDNRKAGHERVQLLREGPWSEMEDRGGRGSCLMTAPGTAPRRSLQECLRIKT